MDPTVIWIARFSVLAIVGLGCWKLYRKRRPRLRALRFQERVTIQGGFYNGMKGYVRGPGLIFGYIIHIDDTGGLECFDRSALKPEEE